MNQEEKETLARLRSYGNMSQAEAVEYHRLLNLEASTVETVMAASQVVAVETPVDPVATETEADVTSTNE